MKNLYTKNEFLNRQEILNEGLFQFLGKMFNKVKTQIKKIKGGNEVEEIYQKYLKIINSQFEKQAGVVLHLGAEEQLNPQQPQQGQQQQVQSQQKPEHPDQRQQQQQKQPEKQNAGYSFYDVDMLNEAVGDSTDSAPIKQQQQEQGVGEQKPPTGEQKPAEKSADTNTKMSVATLKQKQQTLQKILDLYQGKALKEMDLVLQKMGGAEKNPKLKIIIDNKKDQFKLDYLNAEIKFLEKSGDKGTANKIAVERNKLAKSLDTRWNLDKPAEPAGNAEQTQNTEIDINGKKFKLNTPYQYNSGGISKTIMITGKSDDPQKVKAQYVSDKLGKTVEQDFRANLIKSDSVPVKNQKYKYFSKKQNNIIEVEVLSEPDKRGLVKVKTDKGNILVQPGALMSAKKEQTQKTTTPQKAETPEKQTAAAQTAPAPTEKSKKVKATVEPAK